MYFSRRTARCNKALMCLARNYATHWHTRPEKNKITWFRLSVVETCPCTSVEHGATETVSTYLNAFVCSAVVGRVCQCKISAKYGCSVTTALVMADISTIRSSRYVQEHCPQEYGCCTVSTDGQETVSLLGNPVLQTVHRMQCKHRTREPMQV
jgi:hypothetical protein